MLMVGLGRPPRRARGPDVWFPTRPDSTARMSGDRRTDRLPDLLLLRSAAAAWTDGWASRLAAASLGRPLRPGWAATEGWTSKPAAAVLGRPRRPGQRYIGKGLVSCNQTHTPARIQNQKSPTPSPLHSSESPFLRGDGRTSGLAATAPGR
jgi:hypothetical protein